MPCRKQAVRKSYRCGARGSGQWLHRTPPSLGPGQGYTQKWRLTGSMAAGSVRHEMMGRSLKDLINWSGYLEEKGVGLVSLQESIDTGSSTGKLVFHMFGALAEFERNLIRERTMAGLQAARARGKMGGRSKTLSPDQQKRLKQLYKDQNVSVKEICQMMSISKPTLYKYLKNGHKTG